MEKILNCKHFCNHEFITEQSDGNAEMWMF